MSNWRSSPNNALAHYISLSYKLSKIVIVDWGRPFLNEDGESFPSYATPALPNARQPILVVATAACAARLQCCLQVLTNMKIGTLPAEFEERGPFLQDSAYRVLFLTPTVHCFPISSPTTSLLTILGHLGRVRTELPQPGRGQGVFPPRKQGYSLRWALEHRFLGSV